MPHCNTFDYLKKLTRKSQLACQVGLFVGFWGFFFTFPIGSIHFNTVNTFPRHLSICLAKQRLHSQQIKT